MKRDWSEFSIVLLSMCFMFWAGWKARDKIRDLDSILKQDRKERP